ncbi:hypothetical protein Bbelb_363380 [Branchiostoma belcheri]|nr:hypothetical protein Bbelb_363380 [Branchiostoma belcheri]
MTMIMDDDVDLKLSSTYSLMQRPQATGSNEFTLIIVKQIKRADRGTLSVGESPFSVLSHADNYYPIYGLVNQLEDWRGFNLPAGARPPPAAGDSAPHWSPSHAESLWAREGAKRALLPPTTTRRSPTIVMSAIVYNQAESLGVLDREGCVLAGRPRVCGDVSGSSDKKWPGRGKRNADTTLHVKRSKAFLSVRTKSDKHGQTPDAILDPYKLTSLENIPAQFEQTMKIFLGNFESIPGRLGMVTDRANRGPPSLSTCPPRCQTVSRASTRQLLGRRANMTPSRLKDILPQTPLT